MADNYTILIQKLKKFQRKYYLNKLIKGFLFSLALWLSFFLIISLLEHYSFFNITSRTIIFFTYVAVSTGIFIYFLLLPLLNMMQLGKTISDEKAADIIGQHFPEISDKLLNTLQLKKISDNISSTELINASIDKRSKELSPFSFGLAVKLGKNSKYLKYTLPPAIIAILILLISPKLITEPSKRIIHFRDHFEKAAPYTLEVINKNLEAIQNENFDLKVKAKGEQLPENVYIEFNNNKYRLSKENNNEYSFSFTNIQSKINFWLSSDYFLSHKYELNVIPKPIIFEFDISIDYPSYTGKKDEVIENNGDLIVPEGTKLKWNLYTRDASEVIFRTSINNSTDVLSSESNVFSISNEFRKSCNYWISVANEKLVNPDSMQYAINVIPDLYPTILVEEFKDSTIINELFFKGIIKDDYGFNNLYFTYSFPEDQANNELNRINIPINYSDNQDQFFYQLNLEEIGLLPGKELEYFFEIWDNDAINGSKATRSQSMLYSIPTQDELESETDKSNEEIKNELEKSISQAKQLQLQIDKVKEKMVNEEEITWEDRNILQDLLNQQLELQKNVEKIKNKNAEKLNKEKQYKEISEELLEKQKKLEELFEQIMTEEIKKLMEELQKAIDDIDKEKVNEMLEKMDKSAEELSKNLDQSLEWFKQLEFDKKLTETIDKLKELAQKQDSLSEISREKTQKSEEILEEQKKINEEFDKIKKDIDDLHKKNEELEEPNDMLDTEESEEEIQKDLDESLNKLEDNKRKKASESQKSAGEKMNEMSDLMISMQQMMQEESMGEDIEALREILENLVQLSFNQEDLMELVLDYANNDPRYPEMIQEQKNIRDDLQMVEDSLYALSKRQMAIEPFINKEIEDINSNVQKTIDLLNERRISEGASKQQYVMTSINNLALLLSEALKQMQQSLSMSQNGSCNNPSPNSKPGGGKSGKPSMSELQKQLNDALQKAKEGKKGKDGKSQEQSSGQASGQSMSEQMARMAAQQEAIRRQLQEYLEEMKDELGQGDAALNKLLEDMEKTETEIVNKMISDETLIRQQDILTRLLQHERAEREREKEARRKSTEAKNKKNGNPPELFEYNSIQSKEAELLRTVPPKLKPYYKEKVTEYLYHFLVL
ncbi:DUF4175 family protein [Bacteroidota bacterium]